MALRIRAHLSLTQICIRALGSIASNISFGEVDADAKLDLALRRMERSENKIVGGLIPGFALILRRPTAHQIDLDYVNSVLNP